MKKSILLMAMMIIGSSITLAQGIGIEAGLNLSKWEGDAVESSDMRLGYRIGISYQASLGDKLILEPGILLSRKGTQEEYSESFDITEFTSMSYKDKFEVTLTYLEIPVLFKYFPDDKFNVSFGPSLSFLLNNNVEFTSIQCIDDSCTGTKEEDEFDEIRNTDFGLIFGLGYRITEHLTLNANYHLVLYTLDSDVEEVIFNRLLSLSLGFRF